MDNKLLTEHLIKLHNNHKQKELMQLITYNFHNCTDKKIVTYIKSLKIDDLMAEIFTYSMCVVINSKQKKILPLYFLNDEFLFLEFISIDNIDYMNSFVIIKKTNILELENTTLILSKIINNIHNGVLNYKEF